MKCLKDESEVKCLGAKVSHAERVNTPKPHSSLPLSAITQCCPEQEPHFFHTTDKIKAQNREKVC